MSADTELRDLFAQRTDGAPRGDVVERVAGSQRKARAIRRQRIAGGAALTVLAVAAAVVVVPGLPGRDRATDLPADKQTVAHGLLPVYRGGGKVLAAADFRTAATRISSITFTPTTYVLSVATTCDKDMPSDYMVSYEVNGHEAMAGSCSIGVSASSAQWGQDRAMWQAEYGVTLGQPATLTARIVRPAKGEEPRHAATYDGALDKDYRVAFAVYQPVPLADYPLPSKPAHLDPWQPVGHDHGSLYASYDAARVGTNTTRSTTLTLPPLGAQVDLSAGAPGRFVVAVDGTTILDWSSWTWDSDGFGGIALDPTALAPYGLRLKAGQRITVTITTSRFTEPRWSVDVSKTNRVR